MTRRPHPKLGAAFLHADDAGAGVKAADRAPTAGAPGGQIRLVPGGETGRAFSVVERTARSGSSKTKGSYVSFVAFLTIRAAAWFTSSSASLRFLALAFRAAFAATCSDLRFANSLGIRIESLTAGLRGFMATPSHRYPGCANPVWISNYTTTTFSRRHGEADKVESGPLFSETLNLIRVSA